MGYAAPYFYGWEVSGFELGLKIGFSSADKYFIV
jgi:hypothetical protein